MIDLVVKKINIINIILYDTIEKLGSISLFLLILNIKFLLFFEKY